MTRTETDAHLASLDHPLTSALSELCRVVRSSDPRVGEEINWNSPSFFISDHFATTNLRPRGPLLLVLHAGVKKTDLALRDQVADPDGLLEWKSADRAIVSFAGTAEVHDREDAVTAILNDWIAATQ
ncbi:DUF1801 domain-containing protein [Amnibacterium flavum]|uniref:DUF1801 domain-containing protein n=1 Tax=Amnibacterium flavum TaxID=2173173 RepID=A0A2V1HPM7_9MICO|nr:DUF1801 domain-containing protein [Amnibacterium flavum]PVZ94281.1 DUF1801 domain-containing protein [Amnibacterium flavum]